MSTKPSSEETPDLQGAFPRLSDAEIAALDAQGQRRPIQPNDVLFAAGDGEAALEAVIVTDNRTGTRRTIDARALFVFIGMAPCTGWLGGLVDLDDHGFARTGPGSDGAGRSLLETSQPGIFAVGDVRAGSARRVATAVGEGAMAIRLALERTCPT
jgi:thioredoxin reductase